MRYLNFESQKLKYSLSVALMVRNAFQSTLLLIKQGDDMMIMSPSGLNWVHESGPYPYAFDGETLTFKVNWFKKQFYMGWFSPLYISRNDKPKEFKRFEKELMPLLLLE